MAPSIIDSDAVQGETFLLTDLCIRRLRTAVQLAWPSGADRELRPWPPGQVWKLKLHG